MKKDGYYSSGEFARMAHVTLRTVRYYDKQDILKPSLVTESGARFYTDEDFARLQQILLLKYLGFSLDDIREMTIGDSDYHFMLNSLNIQLRLVRDRIEQMQLVEKSHPGYSAGNPGTAHHRLESDAEPDPPYRHGKKPQEPVSECHQYFLQDQPPQPLFTKQTGLVSMDFQQCHIKPRLRILELGCGDGTLWTDNLALIPEDISITLSDISSGMLRDARRAIGSSDTRFAFRAFDCKKIPYKDESFDLVIANHVLFYCDDIPAVLKEICRVLSPEGHFLCSAYGKAHMQEVSQLVEDFDNRIVLSADKLYERFGRENGRKILEPFFPDAKWLSYEDFLLVQDAEPLISYVLSCHGNQNQYILDHYKEFRAFATKKLPKVSALPRMPAYFFVKNRQK